MKIKESILIVVITLLSITVYSQNNITITDNSSHNADASAMLDVYSTSKGMLIPRMSASQIAMISSPATGLLVFNIGNNSFWFFNGSIWQNLSDTGTDIWGVNGSTGDVYVNDLQSNIGIGTSEPVSKLAVVANPGANPDDALFEIQDENGFPIFSVTSEGVRIYVKDVLSSKGVSGGFAVGKYGAAKGTPDSSYLVVTPDSTRVYMRNSVKGVSGGFAVGKYGAAKGASNTIFYADADSTRIFTNTTGKGVSGGFAVGKYGAAKGAGNYMHMTSDNYFIGHNAGFETLPLSGGVHNIFVGYESGLTNTIGHENTYIGHLSGQNQLLGTDNVFLGNGSGQGLSSYTGIPLRNVILGAGAGRLLDDAIDNVFIGHLAGEGNLGSGITGDYNVIIGESAGRHITEGNRNVFMGTLTGFSSTSGGNNVFIGTETGYAAETINANVFIGPASGYSQNADHGNIYIGNSTGMYMESGGSNVFLGTSTGWNQGSGADNVIIGANAATMLYQNGTHTGSNNVVLGADAGDALNGDNNIFIGSGAGGAYAGSNRLYIENSNMATPLIFGRFDTDLVGINSAAPTANLHIKQVGVGEEALTIENDTNDDTWSFEISNPWLYLSYNGTNVGYWNTSGTYIATSDKRLKKDIKYMDDDIINKVMKLKPATYRLLHTDIKENKVVGFIAQEVQEYFPELVYQETEDSYLSLHYPDFGVIAIKAIQEQQEIINNQEQRLKQLEESNKELRQIINILIEGK